MNEIGDIPGNTTAKKYLTKILATQQVPHLLLFSGPQESGTCQAATLFAQEWMCQVTGKPLKQFLDLHLLKTEGKLGMHSVGSIHEMIEKAALAPMSAAGKVFIIEHAERMLPSSANALLKLIEEPHKQTLIILVTAESEQLLPTIRSRCQLVRFYPTEFLKKQSEYQEFLSSIEKEHFSFVELSQWCELLQKKFDARRKGLDRQQSDYSKDILKEMNAKQLQKIEQELEGAAATQWIGEVENLLVDIVRLYRQKLDISALDKMYEALVFAKLALQRATPLKNVLEHFFLSFLPSFS